MNSIHMTAKTHTVRNTGTETVPVTIETEINSGFGIHMTGLASGNFKESLLRTVTALQSAGFQIPGKKILMNMSPADLRKAEGGYDVAMAVGILAASGQIETRLLDQCLLTGNLDLDGNIKASYDTESVIRTAETAGFSMCILPWDNFCEASGEYSVDLYGAKSLQHIVSILKEETI